MAKCWICGKVATKSYAVKGIDKCEESTNVPIIHYRAYCDKCFEQESKHLSEMRDTYILYKKLLMLERAERIIENARDEDIYEYQDIILDFRNVIKNNPDAFDSSDEMVAAIILADNCIHFKHHHKIGKYEVDFYIPELKVVLEIDGELHDNTLYRDKKRDEYIRQNMPSDWEIIRIGTKFLEQTPSLLVEAIKTIKEEKQKFRDMYGKIPEWYSKRNNARKPRKSKRQTDDEIINGN